MLKKLFVLPLALVAAAAFAGPALACGDGKTCSHCEVKASAAETVTPKAVKGELVTESFKVTGMTCGDCAKGIQGKLMKLDGVSKVVVDVEHATANVTFVKGKYDAAKLTSALGGHFKLAALPKGAPKAHDHHDKDGHGHDDHGHEGHEHDDATHGHGAGAHGHGADSHGHDAKGSHH